MISRTLSVCLILCCLSSLTAADGPSQPFVGYRNDATGVYPADCTPVTAWQEGDFKTVPMKDDRGRVKPTDVFDKANPVNLAWKTEVQNWCNGGLVVAGGKLFVQCDRGGQGYARDIVPDFLGNQLVCLDPADGKVLWKRDLHHIDKLPAEKADQVAADLKRANAFYVKGFSAFLAYRRVAGPLLGGGHGMPNYSETMPEGYDKTYADAAKAFSAVWKDVPSTVEALKAHAAKDKDAVRTFTWNYVQLAFGKFMKKHLPEEAKLRDGMGQYGYDWCAWYGMGSYVGAGMQTPVSDGRHIYVHTGYNDVFCYDLEGNRKWSVWFGPNSDHHGTCLGAPVLVGDVLVVNGGGDRSVEGGKNIRGIDKNSGEILWTLTKFATGKSYTRITPVPLTLPIAGTDKVLDVIWTGPGNVIRVRDGKILATGVGCHGNGRHVGVSREKNIIVLSNGSADGGAGSPMTYPKGTIAVQLKAESADKIAHALLWSDPQGGERLVVKGDRVYGFTRRELETRDLLTGKVLSKISVPLRPFHFSLIAGDHLFALDQDGQCLVTTLGDKPAIVGVNRLGLRAHDNHDYFNQGSQMFFSGNRIFIPSYTHIYAIGTPGEPLRLSEAHK